MIEKNVYDKKAGSFIDKSAGFQTTRNRLMDIKSAQYLVRLVPGRRCTLERHISRHHLADTIYVTLKLIKIRRLDSEKHLNRVCIYSSDVYKYYFSSN